MVDEKDPASGEIPWPNQHEIPDGVTPQDEVPQESDLPDLQEDLDREMED